jgi:stage IV sporulation protein FB
MNTPSHTPRTQPRRWSWRLGRIAGIETRVHATFILLLAWVAVSTWWSIPSFAAVLVSLLFTGAVFGSVLLHELGHALMARRFGIQTRQIVLLPIGGVAELERLPDDPKEELQVAIAGPAVNFALATILGVATWLTAGLAFAPQVLGSLAVANLMLGVFNLLPAFPLDGGRVLRALLETRRGRVEATQIAATLGKVLAVGLGIYGLFANPVLVLIAAFVWFAASAELRAVRHQDAVNRLLEVMEPPRRRRAPGDFYRAEAVDPRQGYREPRPPRFIIITR